MEIRLLMKYDPRKSNLLGGNKMSKLKIVNNTKNVFLNSVCAHIRVSRPIVPPTLNYALRVEKIANSPFVTLWFRTRGCRHDYMGGCSMCNYGKSTPVAADDMIEYVKAGLSLAPNEDGMMLLVSPSGSMLDDWEVPAQAREGILELVRKTNAKTYVCETRIETVTDEKIKQYVEILDNKFMCIEVGLESSNPWVSKYCVNKELSLQQYIESMGILRRYKVLSIANVIIGSPFLSPKESIEDAVESIRWALSHGTDRCTLFPVHVKRWTLVEWLWEHGQYSPTSLWSLVEVLNRLGPELAQKVTISWYKLYIEKMAKGRLNSSTDLGYLSSPTTCPICHSKVISLLDTYRDTNDFSVIVELTNLGCACKDAWRSALEKEDLLSLPERVASAYASIGRDVLGKKWWDENGANVLVDVNSSATAFIHSSLEKK